MRNIPLKEIMGLLIPIITSIAFYIIIRRQGLEIALAVPVAWLTVGFMLLASWIFR